jgi:hypothetical protein
MTKMEGFYKLDGESLLCSELVCGPTYMLIASEHATYEYPVDGWYWFDSEEDAREFFGLPLADDTDLTHSQRG